jgi:hypothetical protein
MGNNEVLKPPNMGKIAVVHRPFIYAGTTLKPEQTPGSGRTRTPSPWTQPDGVSGPGGAGASASVVPAEYEAEPGHRRPPGGAVREAAAHASG